MRSLAYNLELALQANRRRPAYKVLAFLPSLDSMSAIVNGTYTQEPLDLTDYCSEISWTPGRLSFTLEDKDEIFHPDFGGQRKYLDDGAILRLREGDVTVAEADWINTFTGQIQGQVGWKKSRRSQVLQAKVSVYSRENNQSWKRRSITTKQYTTGTEIGVMLYDICTGFMGLAKNEIRVPSVLGLQLKHLVNQIAQLPPWDAVTTILGTVCLVPFFDGDGRLACYSKNLTLPEARRLKNWKQVFDYEVPEKNQEAYNKVRVVFLDSLLEKVEGTYQVLGSASATAGFFTPEIKIDCYWSDDRKQRAQNTTMRVKQSVVTKIGQMFSPSLIFGGQWATESYTQVDDFHGRIKITVPWWTPVLFGLALLEYLANAAMPDDVIVFGWGASEGITIPIGRIMQALTLIQILGMMMCIGTGQYEIWGTPYDYCYLEKESIAVDCAIEYWQENEMVIKNDFLGSPDQADAVALTELIWQKSLCFPRKLVIQDDPALELGDMIRLPDGIKFFITGMFKQIKRGEVPMLNLEGFKVKRA